MNPRASFQDTQEETRVRFSYDPDAKTLGQMQNNVDCLLFEIQRGFFKGGDLAVAKANAVKFARRILRRQGIEV